MLENLRRNFDTGSPLHEAGREGMARHARGDAWPRLARAAVGAVVDALQIGTPMPGEDWTGLTDYYQHTQDLGGVPPHGRHNK